MNHIIVRYAFQFYSTPKFTPGWTERQRVLSSTLCIFSFALCKLHPPCLPHSLAKWFYPEKYGEVNLATDVAWTRGSYECEAAALRVFSRNLAK